MSEDEIRLAMEADRRKRSGHQPDDILRMARHCPIANSYVMAWRAGQVEWGEAVVGICVGLKAQNDALMENARKLAAIVPFRYGEHDDTMAGVIRYPEGKEAAP
jgi:hypothetical protein